MQWLLDTFGHKTALRVWSLVLVVLGGPLFLFLRPRLPISRASYTHSVDFRFLYHPTFLVYEIATLIQAIGFFLPTLYLPTQAESFGASDMEASLTITVYNLATVFGCIIMGILVDHYHATTCILVTAVGSTVAIFAIWGFTDRLVLLYVFCILYGMFAGSFSSSWAAIIREVTKESINADPSIVLGMLSAARGIGNIASGPLSEALLKIDFWQGSAIKAYGSEYGPLIVFTGVSAALSALGLMAKLTTRSKNEGGRIV